MDREDLGTGSADAAPNKGQPLDSTAVRSAISQAISSIRAAFVARDDAARWLVLAAIAGEPALLIGPAGSARSALARALAAVTEARFAQVTIDPHSPADDALAGFDNSAATVLVIDDALDATGASLRAVRALLDRREPNVIAVATALSTDDAEPALLDRFVVRVATRALDDRQFVALLALGASSVAAPAEPLTAAIRERIRSESATVRSDPSVRAAIADLRRRLAERDVVRSDRWWLAASRVLCVAARCDGRDEVEPGDLSLLASLFDAESDVCRAVVKAWLFERVRAAIDEVAPRLYGALSALGKAIDEDNQQRSPKCDASGSPLFRLPNGDVTTAAHRLVESRNGAGERLYRAPPTIPNPTVRTSFSASELYELFFVGRVSELKAYTDEPANFAITEALNEPITEQKSLDRARVDARIEWLATIALDLRDARSWCARVLDDSTAPLWVDPARAAVEREFARALLGQLDPLVSVVSTLRARIASLPVSP